MASKADPAARPAVIARAVPPDQASLIALLQLEADLRRQASEMELVYFLANESRRLFDYGQMFVLRLPRMGDGFRIIAASSLATIDRNAPLVRAIEASIAAIGKERGLDAAVEFDARAYDDEDVLGEYPFESWTWQPLRDAKGQVFAGLLVARDAPLREAERFRLDRLAETSAHAWRALSGPEPVKRVPRLDKRQRRAILIILAIAALMPTRMSVLAPVETVAARPFTISAPFSGVISTIEVSPNDRVRTGQPLVRFDDVKMRNELTLATEKLSVARARLERASSAAFGKAEEAREIAIMRAELDLAQAEHDYARDMLGKTMLAAPRDGIALYSDRRDFEGRAVNVGDPIIRVADPQSVRFRIDLPASEQMALSRGAPVEVWLDSQPLWSIDAKLEQASYSARKTPEGVMAFALVATPIRQRPDIGARGTARVYGRWVPLIYALLKRPISAARQTIGF